MERAREYRLTLIGVDMANAFSQVLNGECLHTSRRYYVEGKIISSAVLFISLLSRART